MGLYIRNFGATHQTPHFQKTCITMVSIKKCIVHLFTLIRSTKLSFPKFRCLKLGKAFSHFCLNLYMPTVMKLLGVNSLECSDSLNTVVGPGPTR